MPRALRWLAIGLLAALVGCAARSSVPPAPGAAPTTAADIGPPTGATGTRVGTTASGGTITLHDSSLAMPAALDTVPSAEALAVLRDIPEPLGGEARPETAQAPVPTPTRSLGDSPGGTPAPAGSAAAPTGTAAAAPSRSAAPTEPCWRVQVAAPPEPERAERLAAAAHSQLGVVFGVEREGGLSKVRSRECLSGAAATDLKSRAEANGFTGAFRFTGKQP